MSDNKISSETIDIKSLRHKAEMPLHVISLILSLAIYAVLTYLAVQASNSSKAYEIIVDILGEESILLAPLIRFGAFFIVAACIVFYLSFIHRGIKTYGGAIADDIPITKRQFSALNDICRSYAEKLNVKRVPELYISDNGVAGVEISSLFIKSKNYIRLNSYYALVAAESKDYSILSFDIGTELAHIALGHRNILWVILTIPARVLPLYKELYARALNYSADKVAAELVGRYEAANAIITLTHDPYLVQTIDKEIYFRDITDNPTHLDSLSVFYYNLLSYQSIPAYRISAILNPERKNGKLL